MLIISLITILILGVGTIISVFALCQRPLVDRVTEIYQYIDSLYRPLFEKYDYVE